MQQIIDLPGRVWGGIAAVLAFAWAAVQALNATGFISPVAHKSSLEIVDVKIKVLQDMQDSNRAEHKEMRDEIKQVGLGIARIEGKMK